MQGLRVKSVRWDASIAACAATAALSVRAAALPPAPAGVQVTTEYGIEFSTVGSPGNAPFVMDYGGGFRYEVGRVDHEFRIARTEVTGAQWLEFVEAYAPFVDPEYANNSEFESLSIIRIPGPTPGTYQYYMPPGAADYPIEAGWRYGARYVNWLHNGKALTREAFETGVYDTSTFGHNPDGTITDQAARSLTSRFFLVTRDEWVKAGFFDPDRYGEGQPGYWTYPMASDTPPVGGPPGIGNTSAGYYWDFLPGDPPPVGAYADGQSPWGIFDLSGGVREWNETMDSWRWRVSSGSHSGPGFPEHEDTIRYSQSFDPRSLSGFRVGTIIPAPFPAAPLLAFIARRRRLPCN